ncbi:MAG: outer membrane protein assembly factor BamA [Deltaproteobacteria bacterium]|jgi:outer membrane protein insertion porin family|nr:outer membrane protein assembly factor BamA [Deltaproteobacteria bacterium]
MNKKYPVLVILMLVLVFQASAVFGQTSSSGQKVAIVPFRLVGVTGPQLEQLNRLSQALFEVAVGSLTSMGFVPLTLGAQTLNMEDNAVVAQARQLGADFLFAPSLAGSGTNFTVAGTLLALTSGLTSSQPVTLTATSPDALAPTTERLLEMVTDHLFGSGPPVVSVTISGSTLADDQSVLNSLRTKKGGTYNETKVASDIRRLYGMGFFENVTVETVDAPGGKAVNFVVSQRPQIGVIEYVGNEKYDKEDLDEVVGVKIMDVASNTLLTTAISNLLRHYSDKGYPEASVNYTLEPGEVGRVRLVFNIVEGAKMFIRDIRFDGNDFYSARKLRGQLESTERNFFISWLTGSGKLDREKLANDSEILLQFYRNNGFLQAQVGDYESEVTPSGDGYIITFPIVEGPRYRVGEITLSGDLLEDDDPVKILKQVEIKDEKWLNSELLQADINRVKVYYADKGYAFNEVTADFGSPDSENRLPITFTVMPRNKVYYGRIIIVGNEKTRDKVIRRHLEVAEGDLTSSTKLRQSQNNLMRSSFFDDVNLVPSPASDPEEMDLRVEVKERPTGSFQVGAGYSNYNSVFGIVRLTQDNLFGYGRRLALEAQIGSDSNYFNFSFTDPWVGDMPLMVGIDLFKYYNSYDYYEKDSFGGALRAGYPIFGRFYLTGTYSWEKVKLSDISAHSTYLQSMVRNSVNSTVTVSLRRDTRNHFFQPTAGSTARLSYTIASGLFGGETFFNRYEAEYAHWIPIPFFSGAAVMGHVEVGYQKETRPGGLPIYEKYMLGGINSVRGYDWYDISPKDPLTNENIGGEKMMVINLEFTFPLLKDSGLFGVAFYDMGNAWSRDEDWRFNELKCSYGAGIRYLSPMGPLRIEYGKALDPEPGDPSGRWEFTMGAMF